MNNYVIPAYVVGFVFGLITCFVLIFRRFHATLRIDESGETKDIYRFEINIPIGDLPKQKYLLVRVKKVGSQTPVNPNLPNKFA